MEVKTNYTMVGVIVITLLIGLITTMLWLSIGLNQKKYVGYTVFMHEAAAGLSPDAPVKYNGVQVGFVKEIQLNQNDPRQVEIILNIIEGTPITTSTYATLTSQGITGVSYIGLSASTADLTPIHKMPDEPYPVIPSKPSVFNQLDSILKKVSEDLSTVSTESKRLFNEENAEYLRQILDNLAKSSKEFPQMLHELRGGVAQFKLMAKSLSEAGGTVSKTMDTGKDTLDKFSQEAIPPAVILLRRLNAISANLEKVSNYMRQNPAVIIRGTKPPAPGPGE